MLRSFATPKITPLLPFNIPIALSFYRARDSCSCSLNGLNNLNRSNGLSRLNRLTLKPFNAFLHFVLVPFATGTLFLPYAFPPSARGQKRDRPTGSHT